MLLCELSVAKMAPRSSRLLSLCSGFLVSVGAEAIALSGEPNSKSGK